MPFNLSFTHLVVVAIVALVVLGPERLPAAARSAGNFYREWKRMSSGLQAEVRDVFSEFTEPFNDALTEFKTGPVPGGPAAPEVTTIDSPVSGANAGAPLSAPAATAAAVARLAPALPQLGPSSPLASPGPAFAVEIPPLAPPPEPGTFVPHPEADMTPIVELPSLPGAVDRDPGAAPSR